MSFLAWPAANSMPGTARICRTPLRDQPVEPVADHRPGEFEIAVIDRPVAESAASSFSASAANSATACCVAAAVAADHHADRVVLMRGERARCRMGYSVSCVTGEPPNDDDVERSRAAAFAPRGLLDRDGPGLDPRFGSVAAGSFQPLAGTTILEREASRRGAGGSTRGRDRALS